MTTQRIYAGNEMEWASLATERLFIISDARTNGFCLPVLLQYMPFVVHAKRIVVPAGEAAKQLDVCNLIWNRRCNACVGRWRIMRCCCLLCLNL
jgi:3-dehydroquinate synthetase